jgi:hypothetical protein
MVIRIEQQYADTTMRQLILVFVCTSFATFVSAQTGEIQRDPFTVGVGPPILLGNAANHLGTAPLLSAESGYSFTGVVQSDVGVVIALGGADSQNAVQTRLGAVQSGGHDYRILFGSRYVMPSPLTRIEFPVGGGASHLRHSETAPANGYHTPDCYTCLSRGGWGGYGFGNAGYFFGHSQNLHVGTTFEFIAPSTDVAYVPAARAADGWSNLYLEIGVRF